MSEFQPNGGAQREALYRWSPGLQEGMAVHFSRAPLDSDPPPAIEMMVMDVDQQVIRVRSRPETVFRLYGVTRAGESVVLHTHGYQPKLHIMAWDSMVDDDLRHLQWALNGVLQTELRATDGYSSNRYRGISSSESKCVRSVRFVTGRSLWGYQFSDSRFVELQLSTDKAYKACTKWLHDSSSQIVIGGHTLAATQTFGTKLPCTLQFMMSTQVIGCGWISCAAEHVTFRSGRARTSTTVLEADLDDYKNMTSHPIEGKWSEIAPIVTLSSDIECIGREGVFPEAELDPIIQISNVVSRLGTAEPVFNNVFVLDTCARVPGVNIYAFETEVDMLRAWVHMLRLVDPDILTGYNNQNFDLPYIFKRCKVLGVPRGAYLGRIKSEPSFVRTTTTINAQRQREVITTTMRGRVVLDPYMVIGDDHKLRSYTLNAVSAEFLGQQKEDVHYSEISKLQTGDAHSRGRLAKYCAKDAMLPTKLLEILNILPNKIAIARVTMMPLDMILHKGQNIRMFCLLSRAADARNLFVPHRNDSTSDFQGATVLEPLRGYYTDPIGILDFASLYPSIMIAHNLCYSTLIPLDVARKRLRPEEYTITPLGFAFVTTVRSRGVLGPVLTELLKERRAVKRKMKSEPDAFRKQVLNGHQLALKVACNSLYGFTGASRGLMPCLSISQSVTSFGRDMIAFSKLHIETKFTRANGYAHDATVVYGDTDSVMVHFGPLLISEAWTLGVEAADDLNRIFEHPIEMEMEAVYKNFLLLQKKRYAGLKYEHQRHATGPDKPDDGMFEKGIQSVRRDTCLLVANTMTTCLRLLIRDNDKEAAIAHARRVIRNMYMGEFDISSVVLSKKLSRPMDEYKNVAHAEVAKKRRRRDRGTAPKVGDRVSYLLVRGKRKAKNWEMAEDVLYAMEHNLTPDAEYYIDNLLKKAMMPILSVLLGSEKVARLIFTDQRNKRITIDASKGIARFVTISKRCINCKVPMSGDGILCEECESERARILIQSISKLRIHERKFSACWTECQRCQGSLHQPVLCQNTDCAVFFARSQAQCDTQRAQRTVDALTPPAPCCTSKVVAKHVCDASRRRSAREAD